MWWLGGYGGGAFLLLELEGVCVGGLGGWAGGQVG